MHTLGEAMVLVIIVVFLFLQGWRATLIPLIAVPVSLIGAFIFFPMLGFSINTLSLLGLVLAIGLVVDDAIVVVEAVEVGIEHGLSPRDATIKAMDEVTAPVIGIALILAAVFIPAGFMTGITGSLYQQFAITIAISVLISAFNALSLSPALCALLLRPKAHGDAGRSAASSRRSTASSTAPPRATSTSRAARSSAPFRSMILLVGLTVIAVGIGRILPTSFVPSEDQGYFFMQLQLPDAASLQRTDVVARAGRADPRRDRGRAELHVDRRLQPALEHLAELRRLLLRAARAVARARRAHRRRDHRRAEREAARAARRAGVRLPAARRFRASATRAAST